MSLFPNQCQHCQNYKEAMNAAMKNLGIAQAELARVREELEIEKAKFPAIGSPLQKLGALLADLLDEDRFAQAEQFMLAEYADKERVARRAAEIAWRNGYNMSRNDVGDTSYGNAKALTNDEIVAQAMREAD